MENPQKNINQQLTPQQPTEQIQLENNIAPQTNNKERPSLTKVIFPLALSVGIIGILFGLFILNFYPSVALGSILIGAYLLVFCLVVKKSTNWIPIAFAAFIVIESVPEMFLIAFVYNSLPHNDSRLNGLIPAFFLVNGIKVGLVILIWAIFLLGKRLRITSQTLNSRLPHTPSNLLNNPIKKILVAVTASTLLSSLLLFAYPLFLEFSVLTILQVLYLIFGDKSNNTFYFQVVLLVVSGLCVFIPGVIINIVFMVKSPRSYKIMSLVLYVLLLAGFAYLLSGVIASEFHSSFFQL